MQSSDNNIISKAKLAAGYQPIAKYAAGHFKIRNMLVDTTTPSQFTGEGRPGEVVPTPPAEEGPRVAADDAAQHSSIPRAPQVEELLTRAGLHSSTPRAPQEEELPRERGCAARRGSGGAAARSGRRHERRSSQRGPVCAAQHHGRGRHDPALQSAPWLYTQAVERSDGVARCSQARSRLHAWRDRERQCGEQMSREEGGRST
ncbi:hypothetical protein BS78_09G071000 [Paspalum vaginatum]|nr:hypothetical protein BS78_09G071000 [Paspalum vaginatum]